MVVAEGGGVAVVVPDVGAAVLVDVADGVAAGAGVDADLLVGGQAQVAEAVGVPVGVLEGPVAQVNRVVAC
ncbi:hypothetical protein GCM10010219_59960 [Streptomyces netropsis]|nr:hypothetical protein GCM10010219_59960 [Streptomyces netropsis]